MTPHSASSHGRTLQHPLPTSSLSPGSCSRWAPATHLAASKDCGHCHQQLGAVRDMPPHPSELGRASPLSVSQCGGRGGTALLGRAHGGRHSLSPPHTVFVTQINQVILVRAFCPSGASPAVSSSQRTDKGSGCQETLRGGGLWSQCPTSMSPSSLSAPKPEKVMGWQVRSRRLTRQAVCVALKSGTVTSSTRCPSFPASTGGCQAEEPPGSPWHRFPAPTRIRVCCETHLGAAWTGSGAHYRRSRRQGTR